MDNLSIEEQWSQIRGTYPLPSTLRQHQVDAMSLLKQNKHVLLGNNTKILIDIDTSLN